jgi:predicted nuclease with TOPRIM domain
MADNGWAEYSKLVLKELETLASGIDSLRNELQDVKHEIAKMQVREDKVDELRAWKDKIDEVSSPSQLKSALDEIEELKLFKTRAVTIFAVIQFAMAFWAWAAKFM